MAERDCAIRRIPREPGLRRYTQTAAWWGGMNVGGMVQLDTLPDGCWSLRAPGTNRYHAPRYAYDSSSADVSIPLDRGMELVVSGYLTPRIGCDNLQVLYAESVHIPY
jgi:hypothetical protein